VGQNSFFMVVEESLVFALLTLQTLPVDFLQLCESVLPAQESNAYSFATDIQKEWTLLSKIAFSRNKNTGNHNAVV